MRPFERQTADHVTIRELTQPATPVDGSTPCPDIDRMFSLNPGLASIVVQTADGQLCVLDRNDFMHQMTGHYGYGRALYQRTIIGELVVPSESFVLSPDCTIEDANYALFSRAEPFRHREILVSDGLERVGLLSTVVLLREAARLYAEQALHDQLTGLPNRAMVNERLNQILRVPEPHRTGYVALFFLDLDRFKVINDSLGHNAGDRLLLAFGNRLATRLSEHEMPARLGGDEFAVVSEKVQSREAAQALAERILEMIQEPISFDGNEATIGVSIGVAIADAKDDTGTLLRKADIAMYRAKHGGGNRYTVFEGDLEDASSKRLDIETQLRQAVNGDELVAYYQPIVDCDSGAIKGVEALVRWQHPELGLLSPAAFLPLALETGLIVEIDRWMLSQACNQTAAWLQGGAHESLFVSVNVSGPQLERLDMYDEVVRTLTASGLDPHRLQLEITESSYISSLKVSAANLARLKTLGVRIALDDFGTGYSSLNHLRHFPFDVLKIDRAFVSEAADRPEDAAVIRLIIALADAMNSSVTAEGVERKDEAMLLQASGCATAQGYLYGRPVPAADIDELVRGADYVRAA